MNQLAARNATRAKGVNWFAVSYQQWDVYNPFGFPPGIRGPKSRTQCFCICVSFQYKLAVGLGSRLSPVERSTRPHTILKNPGPKGDVIILRRLLVGLVGLFFVCCVCSAQSFTFRNMTGNASAAPHPIHAGSSGVVTQTTEFGFGNNNSGTRSFSV
jgi:hypothetical protein